MISIHDPNLRTTGDFYTDAVLLGDAEEEAGICPTFQAKKITYTKEKDHGLFQELQVGHYN